MTRAGLIGSLAITLLSLPPAVWGASSSSAALAPLPPRTAKTWPAFLFVPNGFGNTPEAARHDLDRVMSAVAKKPGFRRYTYVRIVQISKTGYQADGICTWNAPNAKVADDPRKKK